MRFCIQLGRFIGNANCRKGAGSSNTVGGGEISNPLLYQVHFNLLNSKNYVVKNECKIYLVT